MVVLFSDSGIFFYLVFFYQIDTFYQIEIKFSWFVLLQILCQFTFICSQQVLFQCSFTESACSYITIKSRENIFIRAVRVISSAVRVTLEM